MAEKSIMFLWVTYAGIVLDAASIFAMGAAFGYDEHRSTYHLVEFRVLVGAALLLVCRYVAIILIPTFVSGSKQGVLQRLMLTDPMRRRRRFLGTQLPQAAPTSEEYQQLEDPESQEDGHVFLCYHICDAIISMTQCLLAVGVMVLTTSTAIQVILAILTATRILSVLTLLSLLAMFSEHSWMNLISPPFNPQQASSSSGNQPVTEALPDNTLQTTLSPLPATLSSSQPSYISWHCLSSFLFRKGGWACTLYLLINGATQCALMAVIWLIAITIGSVLDESGDDKIEARGAAAASSVLGMMLAVKYVLELFVCLITRSKWHSVWQAALSVFVAFPHRPLGYHPHRECHISCGSQISLVLSLLAWMLLFGLVFRAALSYAWLALGFLLLLAVAALNIGSFKWAARQARRVRGGIQGGAVMMAARERVSAQGQALV